jgi:hypothetical protein
LLLIAPTRGWHLSEIFTKEQSVSGADNSKNTKKPAQILFHAKRPHTITNMNDNIINFENR